MSLPLAVLLAGAACRPAEGVRDPFEGAIHVPRVGHTVPIGGSPENPDVLGEEPVRRGKPTPGRYGGDIDDLQRVIEARWASRERHEAVDGVDLDAAFSALRKDVGRSTTRPEFAIEIREALCRLGDGHLRIIDSSMDARPIDSGLRVDVVGGAFVVTSVDERYAGGKYVPAPGDMVMSADGEPIGELGRRQCLRPGSTPAQREHLLARSLGSQSRIVDETPRPTSLGIRRKGRTHEVALDWRAASQGGAAACVQGRKLSEEVGRLDIESFACADTTVFEAELQRSLDTIGSVDDLVVDLRRNGGGEDAQARAAASRLVAAPTTWMRFRHHTKDAPSGFSDEPFVPTPGKVVKADRIWVLTGPGCFSTCEIFASVLATQPNVTLVGAPTAGGVGNPEPYRLTRSELEITIPRTEYALPGTDAPIEGAGVPVDVDVRATLDDVAEGRDAVLQAALDRISPPSP